MKEDNLRCRVVCGTDVPAVTVFSSQGEPMAITHSPTFNLLTSPSLTGGPVFQSHYGDIERRLAPAMNSRLSVSVDPHQLLTT
jgi:hypothetical protein